MSPSVRLGCNQPIDAVSIRIVQAQHIAVEVIDIVDLKLQINAALGHDVEIADEPRMFIRHHVAEYAAAAQFRSRTASAVVDFPAGLNAVGGMNFIHRIRKAKLIGLTRHTNRLLCMYALCARNHQRA